MFCFCASTGRKSRSNVETRLSSWQCENLAYMSNPPVKKLDHNTIAYSSIVFSFLSTAPSSVLFKEIMQSELAFYTIYWAQRNLWFMVYSNFFIRAFINLLPTFGCYQEYWRLYWLRQSCRFYISTVVIPDFYDTDTKHNIYRYL